MSDNRPERDAAAQAAVERELSGALEAGAPLGPSQALPWHQHSLKHTLQAARAAPVPLVASAAGRRRAAGAALGLQPPCSRARPRSGSHRTAWQ